MARWPWCSGEAVPRVMLLVLLVVAIVLAATTLVSLTASQGAPIWCILKCPCHAAIMLATTLWSVMQRCCLRLPGRMGKAVPRVVHSIGCLYSGEPHPTASHAAAESWLWCMGNKTQ